MYVETNAAWIAYLPDTRAETVGEPFGKAPAMKNSTTVSVSYIPEPTTQCSLMQPDSDSLAMQVNDSTLAFVYMLYSDLKGLGLG